MMTDPTEMETQIQMKKKTFKPESVSFGVKVHLTVRNFVTEMEKGRPITNL